MHDETEEGLAHALDDALDQASQLLDEPTGPTQKPEAQGIGSLDERYKTRRVVTRSSGAWVIEGQHVVTGRSVALKVAFPNEASRARIRAEATALGAVAHVEGVVSVLDARVDGETASYVVLEWLRGRALEGILAARGALAAAAVVNLGCVLAETLAEMHASERVHGDLAPRHVFLSRGRRGREVVKLIDFGCALLPPDAARPADPWTAPEVAGATRRTRASDMYGLGAVLARTLLGHAAKSVDELPKDPLGALLARSLRPAPTERPSAPDMLDGLMRIRSGPESRPAPVEHHESVAAPKPPTGSELRAKARAGYVTPVRVTRDERIIDGRSEDVSESGMLLVLREKCEPGETLGLRFARPMDGAVASASAKVAWSRPHAGMPGLHAVGVELDASPALAEAIAKYVKLMGVER